MHKIDNAITLYQDRVHTVRELVDMLTGLHDGPKLFDADAVQKWVSADAQNHLRQIEHAFMACSEWNKETVHTLVEELSKKNQIKLVAIAQPIRIALIGSSSGPGVFDLLVLLGQDDAVRRVRTLLDTM